MEEIINRAKAFAYEIHQEDISGHDWYHIKRVYKNAELIANEYSNCNKLVVLLAALLHDIADKKMSKHEQLSIRLQRFLDELSIAEEEKQMVLETISSVSFSENKEIVPLSIEAQIVQDADRLDAIGAIGIARTFTYGGSIGQPMYDPEILVRDSVTLKQYREEKSTTINHFYEKLLLIKNLLNTPKAKELALKKHERMEQFLEDFYYEWNEV